MDEIRYNVKSTLNIPIEEAYKVLRSNIQFCSSDKNIKSIVITSCSSGEGKTTTAINLCISIARTGMKVLLVDADMRKPMALKHLGSKSASGFSNFLSGRCTLNDVINNTSVENLYFVACGPKPPNPAELVTSELFEKFIEEASEQFDTVIIDTPPLGSVIDCAIMSSKADATILVIAAKTTSHHNALRVKEQLEKANARILGVVLNKVKKSDYKDYYSGYDYYNPGNLDKRWFDRIKKAKKVSL